MIPRLCLSLCLVLWCATAWAEDRRFTLQAPDVLVETGVLDYLIPRFSLKTGVRIELRADGAEARFSRDAGVPVFRDRDTLWHFEHASVPEAERFLDWLRSDVGRNAIVAFERDGQSAFKPATRTRTPTRAAVPDADAEAGEGLSLAHCGRCHVINDTNRMKAIGSTPSFAVLRSLPRWMERFEMFYVLKPHGAFTQIAEVTPPFDPARPSPIVPVELTLEELDAIMAYVATIDPADLGAPIQSQ